MKKLVSGSAGGDVNITPTWGSCPPSFARCCVRVHVTVIVEVNVKTPCTAVRLIVGLRGTALVAPVVAVEEENLISNDAICVPPIVGVTGWTIVENVLTLGVAGGR